MPRKAPSPCVEPGCPALCTGQEGEYRGRCVEHGPPVKASNSRRSRDRRLRNETQVVLDKFYGSRVWQKLRAAYIAKHPLCCMCMEVNRVVPADVVDHIVERRDGGADTDWNNLQSLCHACHNDKTQQERRRRHG